MLSGQEVGEPALVKDFGGDDARASIFVTGRCQGPVKWTNEHKYDGGKLSPEQKQLQGSYGGSSR
jgi:hypothetical protein